LGIGDWGLGIGDWGLGPSPIPNPQSPIPMYPIFIIVFIEIIYSKKQNLKKNLYCKLKKL
jgi:hypothetical protein